MSQREAQRLAVLRRVEGGDLLQAQAAAQLGVSVRQVKRLCRVLRQCGPAGLISKRRGLPSNRRIALSTQQCVVALVRKHYVDFGPELAREYLARDHAFTHSTETLRGWMTQAGLWQPKPRRAKRVHPPRERRQCLGELVQIDGSHHDWFEGRSAKCCLLAFIDDATGWVLAARFEAQETTDGYLGLLQRHILAHGVPLALYSDRHGIFTKHDDEDPKPTQFERALLQLKIEPICANSPQAKGRVERLFQTLQDRLVKAMRLQSIDTMEQANAWLAQYVAAHNQRFAVKARSDTDMHRPWAGTQAELASICAKHHQRQLSAQLSCRFESQILQLAPGQPHAPKGRAMVDIAQHACGKLELSYRGHALKHSAYAFQDHLSRKKTVDAKGVNERVDQAVAKERKRLAQLKASMAHQEDQRRAGVFKTDSPANAPSVARRAQSADAHQRLGNA